MNSFKNWKGALCKVSLIEHVSAKMPANSYSMKTVSLTRNGWTAHFSSKRGSMNEKWVIHLSKDDSTEKHHSGKKIIWNTVKMLTLKELRTEECYRNNIVHSCRDFTASQWEKKNQISLIISCFFPSDWFFPSVEQYSSREENASDSFFCNVIITVRIDIFVSGV